LTWIKFLQYITVNKVDNELNKKLIITPLKTKDKIGIFFPSREI
jgi:hypothetical protein